LSLAKSGIVGKSKKEEETLRVFLISHGSLDHSEKKDGNRQFFADSRWAVLPCLLLAGGLITLIFRHAQPLGTFALWVSVSIGHFPAAFKYTKNCLEGAQKCLRISQWLSYIL
jgi:hypothetical protein